MKFTENLLKYYFMLHKKQACHPLFLHYVTDNTKANSVQNLKEFFKANFFKLQKCCFLEKTFLIWKSFFLSNNKRYLVHKTVHAQVTVHSTHFLASNEKICLQFGCCFV